MSQKIKETIELLEQMEFAENDACYVCYSLRPEHSEHCPLNQALAKLRAEQPEAEVRHPIDSEGVPNLPIIYEKIE